VRLFDFGSQNLFFVEYMTDVIELNVPMLTVLEIITAQKITIDAARKRCLSQTGWSAPLVQSFGHLFIRTAPIVSDESMDECDVRSNETCVANVQNDFDLTIAKLTTSSQIRTRFSTQTFRSFKSCRQTGHHGNSKQAS
jgi:hypothetical protein